MEDFSAEVEMLTNGVGGIKGCFLAGGAITSLFINRKIRLEAVRGMYEDGCWCVAITPRPITFIENNETVYQLMSLSWFQTAEQIFDKFDFTCLMAAIDLETREFFRHRDFIRDLAKRKLRFNRRTEFPIGSGLRVLKYQEKN
jgi:hypothetical protein